MKVISFILLICSLSFAQIDDDAIHHFETAKDETLKSFIFLGSGMILVAAEDVFIKKNCGPLSPNAIKIITGTIFGSLALYHGAKAGWDARWIGIKLSREF